MSLFLIPNIETVGRCVCTLLMIASYLRRGTCTWEVCRIYSQHRAVQAEIAHSHTHRHALAILPQSLHDDAAVLWSEVSIRSETRTIGETPHRRFTHRLGQRPNSPAQSVFTRSVVYHIRKETACRIHHSVRMTMMQEWCKKTKCNDKTNHSSIQSLMGIGSSLLYCRSVNAAAEKHTLKRTQKQIEKFGWNWEWSGFNAGQTVIF